MLNSYGKYKVFSRTWWVWDYIDGKKVKVPGPGRKYTHGYTNDESVAQEFCRQWNATHKPGPLSRKCEYMSED